ncbi:somatostatin receptor type 2-like [Ptychodera flava]|uniref:somatostatin receptor type 2-like n=1 Tax=Ptychodera flava TaxID=63121 RepID=UPI003969D2A0
MDGTDNLSSNFSSSPFNFTPGYPDFDLSCQIDAFVQSATALFICILGLLGNGIFLFVVTRTRAFRTILDALLINLCLADSTYLLGNACLSVCILYRKEHCVFLLHHKELCSLILINAAMLYVSIFTIAVIGFERYMAVRKPLQNQLAGMSPRTRTAILIIVCWSLGIVDMASQAGVTQCVMFTADEWRKVYIDVIGILSILVPMLCTITWYALTIRVLKKTPKTEGSSSGKKDDKQIIRMCVITASVAFIFSLPKCIQSLIALLELRDIIRVKLGIKICLNNFAVYLLLLNSTVNPFIYNAVSSRYRRAFRNAFSRNRKVSPSGGYTNQLSSRQQNSLPQGV